ncbi:MAG: hypothetical protein M0006_05180 [Magnetospirillum sp.]|nr:hypothetical protein [Magnetospirillum sp.]
MTKSPLAGQENLLLDYLQRLERHRSDRRAVHIHMSRLQPTNRRGNHLQMAASAFDHLVKMLHAQLFTLANADLMVVYKTPVQDDIEAAIVKLRFLFADDPLMAEDRGTSFCTWYSLEREYQQLVGLARRMLQDEIERHRSAQQKATSAFTSGPPKGTPFTPELLAQSEAALHQADLANLIRRQAVCALVGQSPPHPVFHELFISINDLRQVLMPSVNVASSPWLFQQLTETLDRRVLSLLNKRDDRTLEGDISINLNVSTLLSQEFLTFDDNVKPGMRGTIVLELQKVDIFADLGAYLFARDFVHDRGYRICIDGLTLSMLPFVDRERLGADLIKLVWDPAMEHQKETAVEALRHSGLSRIVLCRCDTPAAIDFGQAMGLSLFQGRHIENTLANDIRRRGIARARPRSY